MRRTLPIALASSLTAVLAAATLTACAGAGASACTAAPEGAASNAVKVDGSLNSEVTIDSTYPLEVDKTERSIVIEGSGQQLVDGKTANLFYSLYNGATGELIEDSHKLSTDPVPFQYLTGSSVPGMEAALHCVTAGSRVVAVIPPADGFGESGLPDAGLEPGQSLVLVADIVSIEDSPTTAPTSAPEAPAETVEKDASLTKPAVDLTTDPPTITLPTAAPPTTLDVQVITEGTGAVVPDTASVTVNYHGVNYESGVVFDSSYTRGSPATFSLDGVIPGFAQAIAGQKVGSTILVTMPPDLAYGEDSGDPATSGTLVFLIEIISAE